MGDFILSNQTCFKNKKKKKILSKNANQNNSESSNSFYYMFSVEIFQVKLYSINQEDDQDHQESNLHNIE